MIYKNMLQPVPNHSLDYYSRMAGATKSLELLRKNIQSAFNKDVNDLVRVYMEKYFRPAIQNIRVNLGDESLHEDSLRVVCAKMLDEAKLQYCSNKYPTEPSSSTEIVSRSLMNNNNNGNNKMRRKVFRTVTSIIPGAAGSSTPIKLVKLEGIRRDGPKWDPARIQKHTLFIMGARANKVLGFGQTRGRLYTKHPELLKYSGDAEDKEWLSRNNLMPPTGGTAYLLLLEDVRELAMSEEYRYSPNVLLHELKGFQAPDFMLIKIQTFVANARTDQPDFKAYNNIQPNFDSTYTRSALRNGVNDFEDSTASIIAAGGNSMPILSELIQLSS